MLLAFMIVGPMFWKMTEYARVKPLQAPRYARELPNRRQNMRIDALEEIVRGTRVVVVVASTTPPPTMKEVAFLIGTKKATEADFDMAEQEGKTIKSVSIYNEGRCWMAKLKVPADVSDKLLITVRFKTVTGLTGSTPPKLRLSILRRPPRI